MSALKGMVTVAAVMAAAVAGLWAGQTGLIKLPVRTTTTIAEIPQTKATGPVIYYRDPDGKPLYALTPKNAEGGQPYVAVHASEDVSFELKEAKTETAPSAPKVKFYRNPMGLPDTSPTPKKDSMGMDYIPVYEGEGRDDSSVKVSPGKIQRTGVETAAVGKHAITRTIKAPGMVQLDERRIMVVAPRFDGYVVSVGPATSGTHVMKGDALASVFGQDVLNQAARLLVEQKSTSTPGDEVPPQLGLRNPGGAVGATRRLENLGVPADFIDEVKREHRVPDTFIIRSPLDGVILERNVVDGQGFKPGDVAFRIADHSVVWVMADVPEGDMDALRPGLTVKVTTRAHPGRTFVGKVAVVYPHLMKETRTVRVRVELPNPDMALLPDMYGDVEIATGANTNVVAVPTSAVIDSGNRQVVLLNQGDGRYESRDVKLGRKGDGFVEVLSGVSEGDKVVVNGNFLIDAESNLQAALKGFSAPSTTEVGQ
jgi:Cu(I)/Ag(I) efflux system membrane fusion protein